MKAISLFSGAGGMDIGLHRAGIKVVALCEIDRHAQMVLRHRWPDVPLHDDVTTLQPEEWHGRADLVHGGSPCQDLSVAGRRAGLDGQRSGLFWHQCRIADAVAAPWVIWENVPGAFSSNGGADFAAVLWGITGALPDVPHGGWRNSGVIVGPKRWAVWRVLDAQHFGVPQRRRRIFVVGGPRGHSRPEVLLEPESLRWDSAPRREAGATTAALTRSSIGGNGGPDDNSAQAGHLVAVAFDEYNGSTASMHHALRAGTRQSTGVVAFSENQRGEIVGTPYFRQLTTGGGKPGQGYPAVMTFALQPDDQANGRGALRAVMTDVAPTIARGDHHSDRVLRVATADAVRRLTPSECERLMGWPDGWTATGRTDDARTVNIADSNRYRMCGNGVVAPVAEWIGRRLVAAA